MGVTRFPNGVEIGDGTSRGDFTIGGTAVTVTAAQLNTAGGEGVDHPVAHVASDSVKVYYNSGTVITGTGTVATGLTLCDAVTANIVGGTAAGIGGSARAAFVTTGTATAGGAVLTCWDTGGTVVSAAATVAFVAYGS